MRQQHGEFWTEVADADAEHAADRREHPQQRDGAPLRQADRDQPVRRVIAAALRRATPGNQRARR